MSPIIMRAGAVLGSALLLLSVGCSKEHTPKPLINMDTGKHAAQWETPAVHGAAAKGASTSTTGFAVCQDCHGSLYSGGISNITCLNTTGCHGAGVNAPHPRAPWKSGTMTHVNTDQSNAPVCALCHTDGALCTVKPSPFNAGAAPGCFNNTLCHGAVGHSAIWGNPFYHGAAAKSAPTSTTGFSYCQVCHGNDFTGGVALQTCLNTAGCHGVGVNAPHSAAWLANSKYTHTTTDQGNAAVCALCHTNGLNSPIAPPSPLAAAGTTPGCFNSTLCHAAVGHPPGWALPTSHGASAKTAPNVATMSGFSTCQICHNTDFSGGIALQTCLNTAGCHGVGVNAPHSPKPWRAGARTHTTTDTNNAAVCATCHTNGANSSVQPAPFDPAATPGCFNNTLCHAQVGHPAGWALPTAHGSTAKAAPSSSAGFSLCQTCHGNAFTGGASLQTCLNTAGCHGVGVNAPHSPKPWRGGTRTHTNTDVNNATVCATCHMNGANSSVQPSPFDPAAAPGCFNNTLCHATPTCGTCHAIPPNGTVSPNVAGQHAPHMAVSTIIVCATCHNGAGSGTALHQNGVADVILDPTFNAKSGTASYNTATNTCSNISCHGGQTTPGWLSGGVIDVNTQCTLCHVPGTTQYNSQNSGRHLTHASRGIACYTCHDTTLLAVNHFTHLNTTVMEGPASATLRSQLQYNGTSCNPSAGGLTGCHSSNPWF